MASDFCLARRPSACAVFNVFAPVVAPRVCLASLSLIAGALALLLAGAAAADDPPPQADALLQEQLASGEFAPALAAAQQSAPEARDGQLAAIARAQLAGGARRASFDTLSQIGDASMRDDSLAGARGGFTGGQPAQGGGAQPDFESLIELITSTIAPTSWDEVGGPGAIQEFAGGVFVDVNGLLQPRLQDDRRGELARLRQASASAGRPSAVRQSSALRKVSLSRLERAIQVCLAVGRPLDEEMQVLAGLEQVQYVLLYPKTGDLVLAGPAGDWQFNKDNRLVRVDSGRPVLRLEDLLLFLRYFKQPNADSFGCSITPTQDGLAQTKSYLEQSAKTPLKPGQRSAWLEQIRSRMGRQNLEVFGIDPQSHAAGVLLEADYHMKRIGIGLEEGTLDVPSYLDLIAAAPAGQAPPALGVLRWWFTLNYQALRASPDRDAFELRGPGVKVLSENELLTATGQRQNTGKSDVYAAEFADRFSKHFAAVSARYPVYAELRNVFDLALVSALIESRSLADQVNWNVGCFHDPKALPLSRGPMPQAVESIVNHRVVSKTRVLAAISGGVQADVRPLVEDASIQTDRQGELGSERERSSPVELAPAAWWWD